MANKKLDIVFLGGRQTGLIGLLTIAGFGCRIRGVVPRDDMVGDIATKLNYRCYDSVKQPELLSILPTVDLLISVHSKEIVPGYILDMPRIGGINVHPCLYKYKGSNPINRLLKDKETKASVGAHWMIEQVDMGEVIIERFVTIDNGLSVAGVYNILYPLYSMVLLDVLDKNMNGG